MENEKKEAYKNGYVTTLMNRRRVIPELMSKNYMIRSSGERMALNTPIQGTAADILKKAMVELYDELKNRNLKSKILHPSKNITRYESVATTSEIEKVLSQKDESVDCLITTNCMEVKITLGQEILLLCLL